MKRKDPKWKDRFDGMLAWGGKAFEGWERSKQRRKEQRKRDQAKRKP